MIITSLLLCIFIVLLHHYIVHYGRKGRLINLIPGKVPIPIFGTMLYINDRSPEGIWKEMNKNANIYYPIRKSWMSIIPIVSISHPDDMEILLSSTKHIKKGYIYKYLHPWMGTGLLTSTGKKWQKRRKILTPTFHFHILKQFVQVLIEEANRISTSLEDIEGSIVEDLVSLISHHTLNAICETAMGISLQNMGAFQQKYREAIHKLGIVMFNRLMKPWYHFDSIFAFTPMGRMQAENLKILHGFTEKIIAERKYYHECTGRRYLKQFKNFTETDDEDIGIQKKRLAMLDFLIAASHDNELSDSDIREEVDTFMFEGHDTVAMGICFALLLLAEHKDIQDRVRDEVNEEMQRNEGKLTMLQNLPYLERCLKESLRLYPSVYFIARVTEEDVKLHSYVVPSGTTVHVDIYNLHRDPNYWPNPDVFDPDRFLPENIKKRHPFSYVPFSAGPRNCIGQRFAMMELKAVVASLVHNFHLEPVDYLKDLRFKTDIILRVSSPIRIKFVPIKRNQ